MLTDAHCHPFNINDYCSGAEDQRKRAGVMCAASATTPAEFEYCENLSQQAAAGGAPPMLCCFAVHPQMPAYVSNTNTVSNDNNAMERPPRFRPEESLSALAGFAEQGRIAAVGETGFDLFNAVFREMEKIQERLFDAHIEIALRHNLPVVIHVRRAMHKIFSAAALLKKCPAVIFHSWPGTEGEGKALLARGINAFFSFGTTIMLNHRRAMQCCAVFPAGRLLVETDAPFQPPRGRSFSVYGDITSVLQAAAALRKEAGTEGSTAAELENIIYHNFCSAFSIKKIT